MRALERKLLKIERHIELNKDAFNKPTMFDNYTDSELNIYIKKGLTKEFKKNNIKNYEEAEVFYKDSDQRVVDLETARDFFSDNLN